MSKCKRALSLLLVMLMMLSLFPVSVFAEGEKETYSVVINYQFADGTQAAPDWVATVANGSSIDRTVQSPAVVGYYPNKESVVLNVASVTSDIKETVTYYPATVKYTVKHYQQNVDNDNYTLVDTEHKEGLTNNPISADLKKSYDGFTALNYDTDVKIAADGSTVVEIYYDRNYYLLSLNLDGGFGAEPVYARYGAPISVATPTKPGYTFNSWLPVLPATMPAGDSTITAQWTAGQATYLVQYWLENANDDDYSYDSSVQKSAAAGSTVSGSDDNSYTGFQFARADQNVTVNGDGTTVVNVYYNRNTYTLTFKTRSGKGWNTSVEFKNIKYGEDTSKYWSQAPDGYRWCTSTSQNTAYTYAPAMPNSNLTVYGQSVSNNCKYTIHYYEEGTTNKVKEDNTYYRSNDGYWLTDEDYIYIPGFICLNSGSTYANKNLEYSVYYRRQNYTLDFNNRGTIVKSVTVPYEASLTSYNFDPPYPAGLEANAYKFDGWYTDPGCTVAVDWATATMPYKNTVLYAKWSPITHTVTFAKTEDAEPDARQTVAHGALAEKYTTSNDPYTFIGWFYKDESGAEHAFDLSMPVVRDMDLYAKWRTDVQVNYTIHYQLADGTPVADDTTGHALALSTKTFLAKTGSALYTDYQTGFFPETSSHSLVMDANGTNEFTFYYVEKASVNYTVRYLEKGTNKVLHEEKTGTTKDAIITEKFEQVTGYAPDAYQKRLVLSANEKENVLIFWYVKDDEHAPVQIIHWIQNIEGDGYTEYQSSVQTDGVIGQTYTADWLTIEGFHRNEADSNTSGILTAEGLVLNLYYDRNEYNYTFYFKDKWTDDEIANKVTGTARYQAQVSQDALSINGYKLADGTPETTALIIGTGTNEFTFYYIGYFNVVHVKDNGSVSDSDEIDFTASIRDNGYSLPGAVSSGYLYGGAFSDAACDEANVQTFANGENALKFTPEKGQTYYIWEVDQKYLIPKTTAVWRHVDGQETVTRLYLMTPIDRLLYSEVGFDIVGDKNPRKSEQDKQDVAYGQVNVTKNGQPDQVIYVENGVVKIDKSPAPKTADEGYIGMYKLTDDEFNSFQTQPFSFQPYWVTLDGIKVTGTDVRTCTYKTAPATSIEISYQTVGSKQTVAKTENAQSLTFVAAYSYDGDPNAAEAPDTLTITVRDGDSTTAISAARGEDLTGKLAYAGADGKLFAGWFTDEACTVPANLSDVQEDMTVYAKYVSDSLLRSKFVQQRLFGSEVWLFSAIDSGAYAETGFVVNGTAMPADYTGSKYSVYSARVLFGSGVGKDAKLIVGSCSAKGMQRGDTLTVQPYWITPDGTTVYGEERTLTYGRFGLQG